jgi:hypothetical protein
MVGPYQILRLVNRGGQGSVYLGYDKRLRRRVAIKIYPLPGKRAARKKLVCEAQLLASMQSPRIVQIHDLIESTGHLALVMEYVPGCDLEDFLVSVRPSLPSVLTIAVGIAGALTIARQQHIVHGDIKAANVLIGTNGRVKLTDFGIARQPSADAPEGSLSTLSPEQYLGKPVDQRSDLFALGCLMYRMLGGVQPFVQGGQLDVEGLLERDPTPLEQLVAPQVELPAKLVALVSALLKKDPTDRPANTRIVRQHLRRVARALPLTTTNTLLEEARPFFRQESAEDIPPPIPPGLARGDRPRRLGGVRIGKLELAKLRPWLWPGTIAGMALVTAALYFLSLPPAKIRVHIDAPVIMLSDNAELPGEISSLWLVHEVTRAMTERLGPLWVTGPVGATPATTLYANPTMREPHGPVTEQLTLGLRCMDLICVFAVTRNWQGREANGQGVLFPDMSARQWRDVVRTTTQALYP